MTRTDIGIIPFRVANSHTYMIDAIVTEIRFTYIVEQVKPKWFFDDCILHIAAFDIYSRTSFIDVGNNMRNIFSPKPSQDFQLTTEHTISTNNLKIHYNNTNYNLELDKFSTANTEYLFIDGKIPLKIGDNSKWYNMGFKLNGSWNDNDKIVISRDHVLLNPDVKIKSLEVDNLIVTSAINNLSFTSIEGAVLQNIDKGRRRGIIENIGTFTYQNELIPRETLEEGKDYFLGWDEPNNTYKNIITPIVFTKDEINIQNENILIIIS